MKAKVIRPFNDSDWNGFAGAEGWESAGPIMAEGTLEERAAELKQEQEQDKSIEGTKCTALVHLKGKEVAEYVEANHRIRPARTKHNPVDFSAYQQGRRDGNSVPLTLRKGLPG